MDLFPLLLQPVLWERTGTFLFVQQIIEILNAKGTALLGTIAYYSLFGHPAAPEGPMNLASSANL